MCGASTPNYYYQVGNCALFVAQDDTAETESFRLVR